MSLKDLQKVQNLVSSAIRHRLALGESADPQSIEDANYGICRQDRRLFVTYADYVIDERPTLEERQDIAFRIDSSFADSLAALLETEVQNINPYNSAAAAFDSDYWTKLGKTLSPTLKGFCESVHQKRWLVHQIAEGKSVRKLMKQMVGKA